MFHWGFLSMGSDILKYFVTVNYFQVFSFGKRGGLGVDGDALTPSPASENTGCISVAVPFPLGKGHFDCSAKSCSK